MKASIIIRAYNSQDTIERAVQSALRQDFSQDEFEIIVVNDGSTDNTRQVLGNFEQVPNVIIVDQENQGAIVAGNVGFERSQGEYVVLLDSDDYFEPTLVKELAAILDAHPEIDFVYPNYYEEIGNTKKVVVPKNMFETIALGVMYRRDKLAVEGFYRANVFFAEYDVLLRTLGWWKGYHYPEALFTYSRRYESLSANENRVEAALHQLKELHPDKYREIEMIRSYSLEKP